MTYFQWDVSDDANVENLKPPFSSLDTLVLSQGIVMYKRAEFQMPNFRQSTRCEPDECDELLHEVL